MENKEQKLINIIKRQTDYDIETIKQKLLQHNNNLENILKEFHGIKDKDKTEDNNISTNQKIFKTIRDFF
jgi:lipopolysaccharide biosynthesis protein